MPTRLSHPCGSPKYIQTSCSGACPVTPRSDFAGCPHRGPYRPPRVSDIVALVMQPQDLRGLERSALEVVAPSGRVYKGTSCCHLRPSSWPRRWAIYCVEAKYFDPFILTTIVCNCFTMAWQSPLDPCCTQKAAFIDACESIFLIIFTVEMAIKLVAYGVFFNSGAYLKDSWCLLDFIVVTTAWLDVFFPAIGNFSVVRAIRTLRPLRALKRVPGMPKLVAAILSSIPKLVNVAAVCSFLFLIFGIIGVGLFQGSMHYRCASPGFVQTTAHASLMDSHGRRLEGGSSSLPWNSSFVQLHPHEAQRRHRMLLGNHADSSSAALKQAEFDSGVFCNPSDDVCSLTLGEGFACQYFDKNALNGVLSFDSVPYAFIIILQSVSFDEWTDSMFAIMTIISPLSCMYSVSVVVLGGFFVVNLFLAVIFNEFISIHSAERNVGKQSKAGNYPARGADTNTGDNVALLQDFERSDERISTRPFCIWLDCFPRSGWRAQLRAIVTSEKFFQLSTALVVVNLLLMCMGFTGMSEAYARGLEIAATSFTVIFMLEMAANLLALGCVAYWSNSWYRLDGVIVLVSAFELILDIAVDLGLIEGSSGNISFLRALRSFRVLRILRLMKSWRQLYDVCLTFARALPQLANLLILSAMGLVIFALLGMQSFGGAFDEEHGYGPGQEEVPRTNFDYFGSSLITCFILLTGSWYEAAVDTMSVAGHGSILFFVCVLVVGCYLMLNLFVAILLEAFSSENKEEQDSECSAAGERNAASSTAAITKEKNMPEGECSGSLRQLFIERGGGHLHRPRIALHDRFHNDVGSKGRLREDEVDLALGWFALDHPVRRWMRSIVLSSWFETAIVSVIGASSICLALDSPRLVPDSFLSKFLFVTDNCWVVIFLAECILKVISFGFVQNGPKSYLRDPWNVLDFIIVVGSLAAALGLESMKPLRILRALRPLRLISRNQGMRLIVSSLFQSITAVCSVIGVIFAFMVFFAILGMQLFAGTFASCTHAQYTTRDACLAAAAEQHAWGIARRELASARVVDSDLTMRLKHGGSPNSWGHSSFIDLPNNSVWSADADSPTGAVALTASVIHGTPVWSSGTLMHARPHRQLKGGRTNDVGDQLDDDDLISWRNPEFGSFDNFGSAILLLYICSTLDGWEDVMFVGMDAVGEGKEPVRNDSNPIALYFIMWIFVGSFFAMNLFVGVIVENFNKIAKDHDGSATMTPEQIQWVKSMEALSKARAVMKSRPPSSKFRLLFFSLVTHAYFDTFITSVIIANVVQMAFDIWNIDSLPLYKSIFEFAAQCFLAVYYGECVFKIIAFGSSYFRDKWCLFDFILVLASLLDTYFSEWLSEFLPVPPMMFRILRVVRIVRILRVIRNSKGLRDILMTMALSFPALMNVISVLALIVFIYAVMGVNLFTFLAVGNAYTAQRNFKNLGSAALLLFQCITDDGWAALMMDAMITEESGLCTYAEGNCGTVAALPYFISFQIIASFIFLNLVVAVMLDTFSTLGSQNPNLFSASDIEMFQEKWADYDLDADHEIPTCALLDMLQELPPPVGVYGKPRMLAKSIQDSSLHHVLRLCMNLGIEQHETDSKQSDQQARKVVKFQEVLDALIHQSYRRANDFTPPDVDLIKKLGASGSLSLVKQSTPKRGAPILRVQQQSILTAEQVQDFEADADKYFALLLCASIFRERRAWRESWKEGGWRLKRRRAARAKARSNLRAATKPPAPCCSKAGTKPSHASPQLPSPAVLPRPAFQVLPLSSPSRRAGLGAKVGASKTASSLSTSPQPDMNQPRAWTISLQPQVASSAPAQGVFVSAAPSHTVPLRRAFVSRSVSPHCGHQSCGTSLAPSDTSTTRCAAMTLGGRQLHRRSSPPQQRMWKIVQPGRS